MAHETMSLECPSCKLVLQIDVAFAGGVCRCSNCGTLMTVPRDPGKGRAERLMRPDAPAGAASTSSAPAAVNRPARPDAPQGRQTPAPVDTPPQDQPQASDAPAVPAGKSASAAGQVEAGVYITESGRQIRITSQTRIPTAVKRKVVKFGIVGIFVVVMGTMAVLVFAAIMFMNSRKGGDDRTAAQVAADVQKARGGYDPNVNPYLLEQPNVLGLPVLEEAGGLVIVLDTSSQGRRWLANAADAIIQGVASPGREGEVQVILAQEGGNAVVPATRAAMTDDGRTQLRDALTGARPMGLASLAPALSQAVQSKPQQIVLITSQPIAPQQIKSIAEALEPAGQTQFDVVYLGQEPGSLAQIVASHQGQWVQLPQSQLGQWFQQWLDQQAAAND